MLGLALEGGGAKGAYEIGAYRALTELGYHFDVICGVSIGAINAVPAILPGPMVVTKVVRTKTMSGTIAVLPLQARIEYAVNFSIVPLV